MKRKIKILVLVWTIGVLGGISFWLLVLFGRIRLKGYQRRKFNPGNKGLVLISNHPSLLDPIILCFLFFWSYLFSFKRIPYSTPDKKNYYDKWWFWPFRLVSVPIERGSRKKELVSLKRIRKLVKERKVVILFPEGGRTFKGKEFKFSETGERLRKFPIGIRKIFLGMDCEILPIWLRGTDNVWENQLDFPDVFPFLKFWKKIEIIIGEKINSLQLPQEKKEIVEWLENYLVELSLK
jgi:1-acyl-sn-glycerol-3-phosphate acyltransferase